MVMSSRSSFGYGSGPVSVLASAPVLLSHSGHWAGYVLALQLGYGSGPGYKSEHRTERDYLNLNYLTLHDLPLSTIFAQNE